MKSILIAEFVNIIYTLVFRISKLDMPSISTKKRFLHKSNLNLNID